MPGRSRAWMTAKCSSFISQVVVIHELRDRPSKLSTNMEKWYGGVSFILDDDDDDDDDGGGGGHKFNGFVCLPRGRSPARARIEPPWNSLNFTA